MQMDSKKCSGGVDSGRKNLRCISNEKISMCSTPQKSLRTNGSVLNNLRPLKRSSNITDTASGGPEDIVTEDFIEADFPGNLGTEENMSLLDTTLSSSLPDDDIKLEENSVNSCIQRDIGHSSSSYIASSYLQKNNTKLGSSDISQTGCASNSQVESNSRQLLINTSDSHLLSQGHCDEDDRIKDSECSLVPRLKEYSAGGRIGYEECDINGQSKSSNSTVVRHQEKLSEFLLESPSTNKHIKPVTPYSVKFCVTPRTRNHECKSNGQSSGSTGVLKQEHQRSDPMPCVRTPITPAERLRRRGFITPERSVQTGVNFTPLRPFSLYYTCHPEALAEKHSAAVSELDADKHNAVSEVHGDAEKHAAVSEVHAVVFKTPSAYLRHQARVLGSHQKDYIYRRQQDKDCQQEHQDQDYVCHECSDNPKLHEESLAVKSVHSCVRFDKLESDGSTVELVCSACGSVNMKSQHRTPTSRFLARSMSAAPAPGYCNPFERGLIESLHGPINFSPNLFKTSTPGSKAPPTFQWSIDEIAMLKPADIDETEETQTDLWTTGLNADIEEQAQQAIDTFFSSNVIVPSPWTDSAERKRAFQLPTTPCCMTTDSPMMFCIVKSLMKDCATPGSTQTPASTGQDTSKQRNERQEVPSGGGGDNQSSGSEIRKTKAASAQTNISLPIDFDLHSCLPDTCLNLSSNPTSPLIAGGPGTKIMGQRQPLSRKKRGHRQRAKDIVVAVSAAAREDSLTALNNSSLPRKLFFTGTEPSPVRSSSLSAGGNMSRRNGKEFNENMGSRKVNCDILNSSLEEKYSSSPVKSLTNMSPIRRCSTVPLLFNSPQLSPVVHSQNLNSSGLDLNDIPELDSPDESSIGSESSSLSHSGEETDVKFSISDDVIGNDAGSGFYGGSGSTGGIEKYRLGDSLVLSSRLKESLNESHILVSSATRSRLRFDELCPSPGASVKNNSVQGPSEGSAVSPSVIELGGLKKANNCPDGAMQGVVIKKSPLSVSSKSSSALSRYSASHTKYTVPPAGGSCSASCYDSVKLLTNKKTPGAGYEISEEPLKAPEALLHNSRLALTPLFFSTDDQSELSHPGNQCSDENQTSGCRFSNVNEANQVPNGFDISTDIVCMQFADECESQLDIRKKDIEEKEMTNCSPDCSAIFMDQHGDMLDNTSMGDSQMSVYVDSQEFFLPGLTFQQSGDTGYQSSSLLNLQSTNGSGVMQSNTNSFQSKSVPYAMCSTSSMPGATSSSFNVITQVESIKSRDIENLYHDRAQIYSCEDADSKLVDSVDTKFLDKDKFISVHSDCSMHGVASNSCNENDQVHANNVILLGTNYMQNDKTAQKWMDCNMPEVCSNSYNEDAQFVLLASKSLREPTAVESKEMNMSLDFGGAFI